MKHSERLKIFEKVRAEYSDFLSSVLWKLTGDSELFAEAMQNALLIIWQNIEKLTNDIKTGYIYRIALSANSKAWRKRIGQNGQFKKSLLSEDNESGDDIEQAELTEKVRKAISQLSDRQGKAIVMRYFEQQDYEKIAEKLQCSQAGARSHVSKALSALKNKLAPNL